MGGGPTGLQGPDFEKGIALAEVAEGAIVLGHAQGEAVLVARVRDEVFAIGATCTHYGGPLAEGLLVGETVRCPWHHACFELRTGRASCAPALNPVALWQVDTREGRVFVLGKREPAKPAEIATPASVVIVGAGAAGNAAAEMLRQEGYGGPITMLGADPSVPVDRPNLSKDYLAGNAPEEWIPLRGMDFYAERKIDLRPGTRVAAIDTKARTVTTDAGVTVAWGALLLATGAEPVRLSIPGADLAHVHVLRTIAQSRSIIERAKTAKRAVVVGASFIGLEVAASLCTRGLEVDVVAPEARPLERVLGPELGDAIRALHESKGVRFHLGQSVSAVGATHVTLSSGAELAADLVVMGVGVRPSLELAERAGLAIDRGVTVNEYLETSVPGVFAAGDIARWPDARTGERIRVEHWVVAERQGQVAARNILGRREEYSAVPFFWSNHFDKGIAYVGHAESWDRIDVSGDPASFDCAVAFRKSGRTLAVATAGRDHVGLEAEAALERGDERTLTALVPAR